MPESTFNVRDVRLSLIKVPRLKRAVWNLKNC